MKFITTLLIAAVLIGAINILVPKNKKNLKYLISVIFICICFSIFTGLNINVNSFNNEINNYKQEAQNNINNTLLKLKKSQTKSLIETVLNKNKINYSEILVFANILDDYSIKISKVVIRTNEDPLKIKTLLNELDCEKEIVLNGNES